MMERTCGCWTPGGTCSRVDRMVGVPLGLDAALCRKCLARGDKSLRSRWMRLKLALEFRRYLRGKWGRKGLSYLRSLKSRGPFMKKASPYVVRKRWKQCVECPALKGVYQRETCGACGCGANTYLRFGVYPKLVYPYLECPKGKPGFSNEGKPWP